MAPCRRPTMTAMGMSGFMVPVLSFWLRCFALGKPVDALGESILGNEFGTPYTILRLRRECCVAAFIEIQTNNFRQTVTPHIQSLARLQALEQRKLLFVHLE